MTAIPDLATVKGQEAVKRALEVSAGGGHSIVLIGPYGGGKSRLARHLPGLLPPLTEQEAAEVEGIYQRTAGLEVPPGRPYRSPHPSVGRAGLNGGGVREIPGEVSLAHLGVLFLDDLPEFTRSNLELVLNVQRDGQARVGRSGRIPARFHLIVALSPCPCGHRGDPRQRCGCPSALVEKFRKRASSFLDRMEMFVEVMPPSVLDLKGPPGEATAAVAGRVAVARRIQVRRAGGPNAAIAPEDIERHCTPDSDGRRLLDLATERLSLTDAAVTNTLKVARTIADLDERPTLGAVHVAEAIQYRRGTL